MVTLPPRVLSVTWWAVEVLVVVVVLVAHPRLAAARIGTFWHVTDFHYDLNYTTSGDPSNMCWGSGNGSEELGKFGDYNCDAPLALVTSALDAMVRINSKPDFILWTGDDTAHVSNDYFSTSRVVDIVANITNLITERFPDTPVFPVLGNHDYYPKNQFPVGPSPLQSSVADLWKPWLDKLGNDVYDSFKENGRYVADVEQTNVTLVALNTLLWYKSNNNTAALPDTDPAGLDPDGQFAWMNDVLTNGTGVTYLVGHIPPGTFERYQQKREGFHWYQPRYNEQFIQLVRQHSSRIEAQFYAHHHTDSFRLIFKEDESGEQRTPVSYMLLSPGVTPWRSTLSKETGANNPGIRLVSYDTYNGEVVDVSTYYLNLTAANVQGRADWELEYNFSTTYTLDSLNPDALYKVAKDIKNDDETFDSYYRANTVNLEDPDVCTEQCRLLHWCAITEVDYERFYECNSSALSRLSSWAALTSLLVSLLAGLYC